MATEHTSGPWVYSSDAMGSIVATVGGFEFAARPVAEAEANARLIAAAPDLLAALRLLERHLPAFEAEGYIGDGDAVAIRAAIAKATGAQS